MPKPRIISAGNFSRGMMPDQIGARDSAAMIMDGVVDRAGEVRLRGAKTAYGNVAANSSDAPTSGAFLSESNNIGLGGSEARAPLHAFGSRSSLSGAGTNSIYLNTGTSTYTAVEDGTYATGQGAFSDNWSPSPHVTVHDSEFIFCPLSPVNGAFKWAGSVRADYSTGTVSTTSGDKTITGSGTTWTTNVEAGQYIQIYKSDNDLEDRFFRITDVTSNTSLEVDVAPDESTSGNAYIATKIGQVAEGPTAGLFAGVSGRGAGGRTACSHQGRLYFGRTFEGSNNEHNFEIPYRVRWSGLPNETSGKYGSLDYWQSNAYIDVYPGIGGSITGISSLGSSLIILKESAVFSLTGDVSSDGTDLGARLDIVSTDTGCPGLSAFASSRMGLVWANRSGVWLLDGGSVVNLVEGRIRGLYREKSASADSEKFTVSAVGDRIIVQLASGENTFVLDTNTGAWTMQDAALYSKILDVRDTSGDLVGEIGGQLVSTTAYFDKWDTDLSSSGGTDSQSSTTPALKLVTQPIELSDGGLPVGRPSAVYVDGFIREAASTDPYIAVSLLYGASGADTGEEAAVALAKTITEGTYEDVHRIPVDAGDAKRRRQVRVVLESEVGSGECKVYGVWLAATAAETVGP